MKVSDIVKFILENRKNKICKGWTPYQITYDISEAVNAGTLGFCTGKSGELTGVCWGKCNNATKTFYVEAILTTNKKALPELVEYFKNTFKGWSITAERRNIFRVYNTPKFIEKLT